jgi:hypothetical protein
MSIKVVDLQNEEVKEEAPILEPIEEETQEPEHEVSCSIREPVIDTTNEIIEEPKEEVKEEPKEEVKEQPKRQTQKDRINCPRCFKEMSVKSYKYTHQQNCQGQLSEKPVKKHTNPRPKQTPKPKVQKPTPEVYYSDEEEEEVPQHPLIRKKQPPQSAGAQSALPQPINAVSALSQQYALLQQQFRRQKQEKYNNLCQNMFSSKSKRRLFDN